MNSQAAGDHSARFERQTRFDRLGEGGQAKLQDARVLLVGCGALGGALAQSLVRSGVGHLRLVDRDVVEISNLPRQVLFEEKHVNERTPKVEAAVETLERIGGPSRLEPHALHLDAENVEDLMEDVDLVLDGTDNLGTRYLLNDACVAAGIPWIYGGVVGSGGLALAVLPGVGPCLRCLFPDPAPPGSLPTCDTAGVLQPAVAAVAAVQAGLALRTLTAPEDLKPALIEIDVWSGSARTLQLDAVENCPCCGLGEYTFLDDPKSAPALKLCGRNAVQVRGNAGRGPGPDLDRIAEAVAPSAKNLKRLDEILRFEVDEVAVTLFGDGRALLEGTDDIDRALSLYDRWIGS
ncbi:MAG: ThiF family adenylyltransferase [Planctomycetota bacterium]